MSRVIRNEEAFFDQAEREEEPGPNGPDRGNAPSCSSSAAAAEPKPLQLVVSLSPKLAVATAALTRLCLAGVQSALRPGREDASGSSQTQARHNDGDGDGGGQGALTELTDDVDAAQQLAGLPGSLSGVREAHSPLIIDLRRALW